MAFYKRSEFQKVYKLSKSSLAVYIGRKKIIEKDGLIDDSDLINALFIEKRLKLIGEVAEKSPVISKIVPQNLDSESKSSQSSEENPGEFTNSDRTSLPYSELERQKKLADLIKVEADTRLALLKEEKMMGLSIPTDLVKSLIAQLSKSLVSSFKDGADNFLIEISKRKALDINEQSELKKSLVTIINSSSFKAIEESKKTMKSIVNTYSDKKEVGEHE